MNDLSKIDKNFAVESVLQKDGVAFYDVRKEPFEVYGLYARRIPIFRILCFQNAISTMTTITIFCAER
ncbi:MAG: hypothetical protein E7642_07690 [Ruminococcaceae bacterium]|nr:hypothetical protein [Oscillospiraceae bacterium]